MQSSHSLSRLSVAFSDHHSVANAGLVLPAMLTEKLGLRQLIDEHVHLGNAPGTGNVGMKAMTLIYSALAGGDSIEDANLLRAGSTEAVLGQEVRAPSTLGTFLRSFTWGHALQLDAVSRKLLARAWGAGAGPGSRPLTIDLDSTICETYGLKKAGGSRFTYTHTRGYHPLLAVAAGTEEVLHTRLRAGPAHTSRGVSRFIAQTVERVREAGARGELTLRADSGFYSKKVVEISYTPFGKKGIPVRLIVRRVPPNPGSQLALFAAYGYHAFICDREGETLALEADHRRHAEIENVIRDLKYGVGLNHLPSGKFGANAAWLALQVMAHNLGLWVNALGLQGAPLRTKTLRHRFLALPGRLTRSARRFHLALPCAWPWQDEFMAALHRLRALPLLA